MLAFMVALYIVLCAAWLIQYRATQRRDRARREAYYRAEVPRAAVTLAVHRARSEAGRRGWATRKAGAK